MESGKSMNISAADAVEHIEEFLTTAEEITAFIEDDTRKTVLSAAEARIAKLTVPPKPPETEETVADQDIWMYRADQEPKLFKKGEVIPTGWGKADGILGVIWTLNETGWVKIKKPEEKK